MGKVVNWASKLLLSKMYLKIIVEITFKLRGAGGSRPQLVAIYVIT